MANAIITPVCCDGFDLRRALQAATDLLDTRAGELNSLNVFPVPDGDTGTNMALTMQAAWSEVEAVAEPTVANVARAAARGSLLGARGNSGVITSRYLHGFAQAVQHAESIGPSELARALHEASFAAYRAVSEPVEGTILTVGKDVAQAAEAVAADGGDLGAVIDAAVRAGRASVARTPDLLPVLRQAGVVDAGGQGLLFILEGFANALVGMPIETRTASVPNAAKRLHDQRLHEPHPSDCYGYCTEFLIAGEDLDVDRLRDELAELGDSLIVVGDPDLVRVHIHAHNPGPVLTYAANLGSLHRIKIDNMQEQHEALIAEPHGIGSARAPAVNALDTAEQGDVEAATPAIVVVAAGRGFAEVFRSLGAAFVIPGGQSMNPSIQEILRGIERTASPDVILIPNNANILLAAQQVQSLTSKRVIVIPTRNMAEGVAALLALNYEADLDTNAERMEQAAHSLASAEISRAVRDSKTDGLEIHRGDVIGLIDGRLVAVGESLETVAVDLIERLGGDEREVITLYSGADVDEAEAQLVLQAIRIRWPGAEVELLHGNQPHYHFIIAAE